MSFCGQVLCQRTVIGPWALAIIGNPRVAAPAAVAALPFRRERRETRLSCPVLSCFMVSPLFWPGWAWVRLSSPQLALPLWISQVGAAGEFGRCPIAAIR